MEYHRLGLNILQLFVTFDAFAYILYCLPARQHFDSKFLRRTSWYHLSPSVRILSKNGEESECHEKDLSTTDPGIFLPDNI